MKSLLTEKSFRFRTGPAGLVTEDVLCGTEGVAEVTT